MIHRPWTLIIFVGFCIRWVPPWCRSYSQPFLKFDQINFTMAYINLSIFKRFWHFPFTTWRDIFTISDLCECNLRVVMLKVRLFKKKIKIIDYPYTLEKRTSCSQNPCLNDGHCIEAASGSFECVCKSGFSGTTCAGQ